jgi:hypothetical protein
VEKANAYFKVSSVFAGEQTLRPHQKGLRSTLSDAIILRIHAPKSEPLPIFLRCGPIRIKDVAFVKHGLDYLIHQGEIHRIEETLS